MTEVAEVIPFTAWQQAVFVALFIVFFVGVLAWLTKQSEKWQAFMFQIDDQWRAFNKEQRECNNAAMADVNNSITNLTKVTEGLVMEVKEMRADSHQFAIDLRNHDAQAKEILAIVQKPAPKPRAKKPVDANN